MQLFEKTFKILLPTFPSPHFNNGIKFSVENPRINVYTYVLFVRYFVIFTYTPKRGVLNSIWISKTNIIEKSIYSNNTRILVYPIY